MNRQLVKLSYPTDRFLQAASPFTESPTDELCTEHARLKDHVASMTGGLEAKINEGFVFLKLFKFLTSLALSSATSYNISA